MRLSLSRVENWVFLVLALIPLVISAQPKGWYLFVSRGGWTMRYPTNWHLGTCNNCRSVTESGVFVDFFPPGKDSSAGWVMVNPLLEKPKDAALDAFMEDMAKTANVCQQMSKRKLSVNGSPALDVIYKTADGSFMETVYVFSDTRTASLDFSSGTSKPNTPVETLANYPIYRSMVDSFHLH